MTTCWYPQHTSNNWWKAGNCLLRGWPRSFNLKVSPKSIFCSPLVYLPCKSFIVVNMAGTESIGKSDQLPEQMTSHPQGEASDGLLPGDHWTQTTNVRLQFPTYHMLYFHLLKSLRSLRTLNKKTMIPTLRFRLMPVQPHLWHPRSSATARSMEGTTTVNKAMLNIGEWMFQVRRKCC
jgi:hypothetical protein